MSLTLFLVRSVLRRLKLSLLVTGALEHQAGLPKWVLCLLSGEVLSFILFLHPVLENFDDKGNEGIYCIENDLPSEF